MNTPTPRTDECIRTAGLDHSGEAYKLARQLERELAAMQARAEAAEALVKEKDKVLVSARDEIAAWRKEQADEASRNGADSPYADGNCTPDYVVAALALTPESMGSKLAELEKEVVRLSEVAKAVLNAKTSERESLRARIAEQDAELLRLKDELCELRPLCLEHRDAHDAVMAQRDALIAAGDQLYSVVYDLGHHVGGVEAQMKKWDAAKQGSQPVEGGQS